MDFKLPELGEGVYEAELIRWLVKPGDTVRRGQTLMEVMTDKATMEVPSPFAGVIQSLDVEEGNQLKVGEVMLRYATAGSKNDAEKEPSGAKDKRTLMKEADGREHTSKVAVNESDGAKVRKGERAKEAVATIPKAAPSIRLMARKLGIDLRDIQGSGPGGRILIEDLTSLAIAKQSKEDGTPIAPGPPRPPALDYGKPGTRVKFQGLRRKIAENMVRAKHVIPHSTYIDECDVTELVRLRESLRESFAQAGMKLTYLPFFVKAVTAALEEIPIVNSSLDEQAGEIILHDHYHVGVAVATPAGLIVPVLHDADQKELPEIARELDRLSAEAKAGKSRLEDLRGGTFTITSFGGFGGLISTPVVNHPQAAILGVGKIIKRPVFDAAGTIKPADLLYLSLSFDHRLLDGAVAAAFCNAVIRRLQNPAILLLPNKLG